MNHVKKGCLSRLPEDARSDGSRIEAYHKGLGSLQKSFASGLEYITAVTHDHILRRNIRVAKVNAQRGTFTNATHGSHHIRIVSHNAGLRNQIITKLEQQEKLLPDHKLKHAPQLQLINSGEVFGLVVSEYTNSFKGLIEIKDEPQDEETNNLPIITDTDVDNLMSRLSIDPQLLSLPAIPMVQTASTPALPVISANPPVSTNPEIVQRTGLVKTNNPASAKRKTLHPHDNDKSETEPSIEETCKSATAKKARLENVEVETKADNIPVS